MMAATDVIRAWVVNAIKMATVVTGMFAGVCRDTGAAAAVIMISKDMSAHG